MAADPTFLRPLVREPDRAWRLDNADTGTIVVARVAGAFDSETRRRGLLGRDGLGDEALVIAPCNLVHTFFMRFAIDAVFVDREGRVIEVRHTIRPWRIAGAWSAFATIELPAGQAEKARIVPGTRLQLAAA